MPRWNVGVIFALATATLAVGCTKRNPYKCNAEEPCPLAEAPFCDLDGTIGGTPYRCVPAPMTDGGPSALAIDRSTQDFGPVAIGQTSAAATLTITNTGTGPTGTLATAITGAQASVFAVAENNCQGQTLAAAATCTVTLTFAPTAPGAAAASITVVGNPGGSATAALAGTGTGGGTAAISMTPTALDFGSVVTPQSSSTTTFTIANDGSAPSGALTVALGGADAASFAITSDSCTGQLLPAGATCTVTARFTPVSAGSKAASLDVTGTPGGTATAALTGLGLTPGNLSIAPGTRDFGPVEQGAMSSAFTFTITNTGGQATGALAATLTGTGANQFMLSANGCTAALAGMATCTVAVRFAPTSSGAKSATLTVTGTPGGSVTATVNGMALAPASLAIAPTAQNFGDVVVGGTASVTLMVSNPGGVASGTPTAGITGTHAADFTITSNTCSAAVAPAGSCAITVRFAPGATAARMATLTVGATPGGSTTAALSGNGLAPSNLAISPNMRDYGSIVVGGMSSTMSMSVTNNGGAATGMLTSALSGGSAAEFTITADTCAGQVLAAAATCTVTVQFRPAAPPSAKSASLTVSGTPGGAVAAQLSGVALPPAQLSLTPSSPNFGSVVAGSSGSPTTLTVTNTGGVATGAITATRGGVDMGDFAITSNTCGTLSPGVSCLIGVTFTPAAIGAKTASLTVTSSPGGSAAATLSGTGVTAGTLTITPESKAFGGALPGATTSATSFTVRNTGGTSTTAITTSVTGTHAAQFPISADTCQGAILAPSATCTLSVTFAPSAPAGGKTAQLSVSASTGGTAGAALSGTALAPAALAVNPTSNNYGTATVNTDGSTVPFTVTNTGDVATAALGTSLGGTDASQFVIAAGNTCGGTLAAGATCMVSVRFHPLTAGAKSATLTITGGAGVSVAATLTGNAVSAGVLTINSGSQDFGGVLLGGMSSNTIFTITNTGGSPTGVLAGSLGGTNANQFTVTDNCTGMALAASGTCTMVVRFNPTVAGGKSASVSVNASPGGSVSASLSGTGLSPASLSFAPPSGSYGTATVNTDGSTVPFTVTNGGDVATGTLSLALGGTNMADFTIVAGSTCTGTLAAGANCSVSVKFHPLTVGASKSATLTVNGGTGVSATANLSGTSASVGALMINSTSQNFGNVLINTSTADTTFTITNGGGSPTGVLTGSMTGADANQFTLTNNCTGQTLIASGTCTMVVHFNPTSNGSKTASLSVTGSPGGSVSATLMGTGQRPAALSVNPTANEYGLIATNTDSATVPFSVTNTGDLTSATISTSLIGSNPSDFGVVSNGCMGTLAGGASCTVSVKFRPQSLGAKTASLSLTAGAGVSASATLSGTGATMAVLAIDASSNDFGAVLVNGSSALFTFTVSNSGGSASGILAGSMSGSAFALTDNCSGMSLPPAGTCTMRVGFAPGSQGSYVGSLSVNGSPGGLVSTELYGTGVAWGTASLLELDNAGSATVPQVAVDLVGNAVAVWTQSDGIRDNIWASRYLVGSGWGAPVLLETDNGSNNTTFAPQVAINEGGDAVAVWQQYDGLRSNIWANRYVVGSGWTGPVVLETDPGTAFAPQVVVDALSNAVVIWHQSDGTRTNIVSNRYIAGSGWSGAAVIETDNAGSAKSPQLASNPGGNTVAVWAQSDGTRDNIWAARYYYATGWAAPVLIETDNAGGAAEPQIAVDGSGNGVAVWHQSDGARQNVMANIYSSATGWSTPTPLETDAINGAITAQVGMDESGNAVAVWMQSQSIWANRHVLGVGWGTAVLIETDGGAATIPEVAVDALGNAVAVWQQSDGTRQNIWTNRYVPGLGWRTATLLENDNAGHAIASEVALNGPGLGFVVWQQFDGTRQNAWVNSLR